MNEESLSFNSNEIPEKLLKLNKVKERLLIISPTVKAGLERECCKSDFYREGDKCIGKGGFGEVWRVVHKTTNVTYVIKVIDKKNIKNQKMSQQINREIEIMYKVHHPHLMQLVNHFEDDDKFFMIMPYATKGQLYTLLRKQVRLDQRSAAQYMRETIEAVKYLHEHKIMHRDIKPENLLLDENYRVKLSDFGWSNFKEDEDTRKTYCGTPEYLAPEMVNKKTHDYSIDIWSLGVLLFEFLSGYAPFTGSNQNELFLNIKRLKINWPIDFPPLAKNLVSKILKLNPKERPSLDEIINHAWFEKNPPLRPVLTNSLIDEVDILKSHLVNVTADQLGDQLHIACHGISDDKKKNSIQEQRKTSKQMASLINTTTSLINNSSGNSNSDVSNGVDTSMLHNEIERLKKENSTMKGIISKYEADAKLTNNEMLKLKESITSQSEETSRLLNEEIIKSKTLNNERLALLVEIEEKNNVILDINSKLKNAETENVNSQRELLLIKERLSDNNKLLEDKDNIINDLQKKIAEIQIEKDESNNALHKKVMVLQSQMFDTAEDTNNINSLEKVIQMVSDTINEFKNSFGGKLTSLNSFLNEFRDEFLKRNDAFKDIIDTKSTSIIEIAKKFRTGIDDDMTQLKVKMDLITTNKEKEVVEWYQNQIKELLLYKGKIVAYEAKIIQLENEIVILKEKANLFKEQSKTAITKEKLKSDMLEKLNDTLEHLESKLEDMLLYVIENYKEKEFIIEFKNLFENKIKK